MLFCVLVEAWEGSSGAGMQGQVCVALANLLGVGDLGLWRIPSAKQISGAGCDEQARVISGEICSGAGGSGIYGIYPSGGCFALLAGLHQGRCPVFSLCWHRFVASTEAHWHVPRPHLQSTARASICEKHNGFWQAGESRQC